MAVNPAVAADLGVIADDRMGGDARAAADPAVDADRDTGADFSTGGDLGAGIDAGRRMNLCAGNDQGTRRKAVRFHQLNQSPSARQNSNSPSLTAWPSTLAWVRILPITP